MSETGVSRESERTVAFLLSLRARGVRDLALLRAMEKVPRERFAPSRFADLARQDVSVPLACGQTMTAPYTVAKLVGALDMRPECRVLEIGSGSGYVAALLAAMGGQVVSLERYRTLALAAHERLAGAGFGKSVELRHADGLNPDRAIGRFHRILVNGVMEAVPEALLARLDTDGRLVGALRVQGEARLVIVTRTGESGFDHALGASIRLPPLAAGLARAL